MSAIKFIVYNKVIKIFIDFFTDLFDKFHLFAYLITINKV